MHSKFTRTGISLVLMSVMFQWIPKAAGSSIESMTVLGLPTNDLLLDSTRNLLYASVPSTAGIGVGNTITRISLGSQSILDSTFVGSEPGVMTLASDASQLYVSLTGSYMIRAFNPSTLTAGPQTPVADNYMIGDLASVPTQAGTFVGSLLRAGSPKYVGIGVWHFDGTNFTTNGPVGIGAINLAYSSDPSTFYATSGGTLAKVTLGPGDSLTAQYGPPLGSTDPAIALGGNQLVSAPGRTTDTTTFAAAGLYAGGPWSGVAVDAFLNKVFLISGQHLSVFDMSTFVKIDSLTIPDVGSAGSYDLIRFGTNGLAFRTDDGRVFMVESNAVPEPSSVVLAALGVVGLAIRWRWKPRGTRRELLAWRHVDR